MVRGSAAVTRVNECASVLLSPLAVPTASRQLQGSDSHSVDSAWESRPSHSTLEQQARMCVATDIAA